MCCVLQISITDMNLSGDTLVETCTIETSWNFSYSNCSNLLAILALESLYSVRHFGLSTRCYTDSLSFFCDTAIALCNNDDELLPSIDECIEVRDNNCSSEWRSTESLINVTLPDCNSFDNVTNLTFSKAPFRLCPDQFGKFCGSLCAPLCTELPLYSDGVITAFRVSITALYIVNLIGFLITLFMCYYQRAKMYDNIMYAVF